MPAITLEVLPAAHGDCLFVTCPTDAGEWRLLVDTGRDETFAHLQARLARLAPGAGGKRHVDLAVISHIDHDHIGGAGLLLNDRSLNLKFDDIWFNARRQPVARGVAEGESLAALLGASEARWPWNRAFGGAAVVTNSEGGFVQLAAKMGAPCITLLSPNPPSLASVLKVWDKALAELRSKKSEGAAATKTSTRDAGLPNVEALAAKRSVGDRSAPNASSIAVLIEHRGSSVLLAADAVAPVIVPALRSLARQRGLAGPLKVDVLKLSHHGSGANVTADLLSAVQADDYVFSTNNAMFNHPDDEAVARVLLLGGKHSTLWFNYATPRNRRWADAGLQARYGYGARYPASGDIGLTVTLPAAVGGA